MSPMNRQDYSKNWNEISLRIKEKQGWKCAWCGKPHGGLSERGTKIVLTTSHLDHNKKNNEDENLRALCQACHLSYDLEHHIENTRKTRLEKSGKRLLPGL